MKPNYFLIPLFSITVLFLSGSIVHGADPSPTSCFHGDFESGLISNTICQYIDTSGSGGNALVKFVQDVVNLITAIIVAVGLISIVIGGYFYMTAGGSSDRVGTAKTWIVSAISGIILALMSWVILNTIGSQFVDPEIPLPSPPPTAAP